MYSNIDVDHVANLICGLMHTCRRFESVDCVAQQTWLSGRGRSADTSVKGEDPESNCNAQGRLLDGTEASSTVRICLAQSVKQVRQI
jgi:hypothetical protein